MRRGFLLISLVLMTAVAAAEEPLKRPTLEALFEDKALELEILDNVMWLPDSEHVIYWTSTGDVNLLWRQSAATGERVQLADWTAVLERLAAQRPGWQEPSPGDVNSSASHRTTPVLSPDGSTLVGGARRRSLSL